MPTLFKHPPEDLHEFNPILAEIEERPISPLGRTTFWIVCALLLCIGLWLTLGEVDVVITSKGRIIPQGHAKIIQPLDAGVIRKIAVKEGDFVKKGQTLVEIDPSTIEPALESMTQNLNYTLLEQERIQAELDNLSFLPNPTKYDAQHIAAQRMLYNASKNGVAEQVNSKQEELRQIQQQLAIAKEEKAHADDLIKLNLAKQARMGPVREIIPKRDLEQVEEALMEHTTKREEASHRISELYAKEAQIRKEIGYIQSNYRTQLLTDLALMQKRSIELQAQIKQIEFKNDKQTLTSPEDGIIDELAMNTVGGVVQPGQKIMSLIPSNAPLVVESAIQNKDIGYVQTGLPVNVKVDTFDFQKYGIIPGKLLLLSSDSHQDKNQPPVYKASIELQKHSLKVNGNETPLKAGMTVTAEVKVGKRKIIEFFIYPLIRSLNESVSVR